MKVFSLKKLLSINLTIEMKHKISNKHILLLLIFLLFGFLHLKAQNAKTTMVVYKSGTVIFDRDIAAIDSIKFYQTNPATLSSTIEEMVVYQYGTIYFKKDIAEIDSITYFKTGELSPLEVNGAITPSVVQGCMATDAPAVTTIATLELLPGTLTINYGCSGKDKMTVTHTDAVSGCCPFTINRTYTIKDACDNSVSTVQKITIQPNSQISNNSVFIPAGSFMMGSPVSEKKWEDEPRRDETQHMVTLNSFYMSIYEVSNAEYAKFLNSKNIGADAIYPQGLFPDKPLIDNNNDETRFEPWGVYYSRGKWIPYAGFENNPVVFVTWYGAVEYAKYAGGRLPTEAEFEYACRANTTTPFNTGYCISDSQANYDWRAPYDGCSNTNRFSRWHTEPVNSYQPNTWGLYNMHGNISEWCSDWYGQYLSVAQTNPTGADNGTERVVRGGTNSNIAYALRSAYRYMRKPEYASSTIGLRIVFDCTSFH